MGMKYQGRRASGAGNLIWRPTTNIATIKRVDIDSATGLMAAVPYLMGAAPFAWAGDVLPPTIRFKNGALGLTGMTPFRIYCTLEVQNKDGGGVDTATTVVQQLYCRGEPNYVMPAIGGYELDFVLPPYTCKNGETAYVKWFTEHPTDPGNSTIIMPAIMQTAGETTANPLLVGDGASPATHYTVSCLTPPSLAPWAMGAALINQKWADTYSRTDGTPNQRYFPGPGQLGNTIRTVFAPVAILTSERGASPIKSLDTFGDSLGSQTSYGWVDWVGKLYGAQVNNYNRPGSGLGDFPNGYRGRMQQALGDSCLLMHGHNDFSIPRARAFMRWAKSKYEKVIHCGTSWDVYSSANNWNDKSTQNLTDASLPVKQPAVLAFNLAIQDLVGASDGPDAYVSFADVCRDADGLCYVDGTGLQANREMSDNTHLNILGARNTGGRAFQRGYGAVLFR